MSEPIDPGPLSDESAVMRQEVVRREDLSPAAQMFQQMLAQSMNLQDLDVDKLKALLDVQQQLIAQQAKESFTRAFAEMQPELPMIDQNGSIIVKGVLRSKYATFENIMLAISEPMRRHGFVFTFDTIDSTDGKAQMTVTCELIHRDGFTRPYHLRLPIDTSEFRSAIQNYASTVSFGKRQLVKMALNLVEKGEGVDTATLAFITPEQLKDLETMIADGKADLKKFLQHFHLKKLADLSVRDYKEAARMLADKVARRQQEAAAAEKK